MNTPNQVNQDKDNSGVLFRNEKKQTEKQPDYTGTVTVMSEKWRLAGWIKKSKAGQTYLSLAVSPLIAQERPKAKESIGVDF
jgi:uncharacterized protein (DUF736 family)